MTLPEANTISIIMQGIFNFLILYLLNELKKRIDKLENTIRKLERKNR